MTYRRVPYRWPAERELERMVGDAEWRPFDLHNDLPLVGAALADSPNAWDAAAVSRYGAAGAAARLVASVEAHRPHEWEVFSRHGADIGFVLPVVFATGGNGTLWHIGVLSAARGHGLGRTLLRRATATLVAAAVTAVVCDVDVVNAPMIHLFESEGWDRGEEYERELVI